MRIKKVTQTTPIQAEVIDSLDGNSTTNAPSVRAVNEIKGQILWTNPNPTSVFASQTITLSSSDYDYLEFIFKSDYNDSTKTVISCRTIKGYGVRPIYMSTGSLNSWNRQVTYSSDTSYNVGDCNNVSTTSDSTTNNNLIPLYVIGYKTGLFD